jgi:hypothetical protein
MGVQEGDGDQEFDKYAQSWVVEIVPARRD